MMTFENLTRIDAAFFFQKLAVDEERRRITEKKRTSRTKTRKVIISKMMTFRNLTRIDGAFLFISLSKRQQKLTVSNTFNEST